MRLARLVYGNRAAVMTGLLLTLSWHHIWFSQNARGYTILLFGTVLATDLLLRALRDGLWRYWVGYALVIAFSAVFTVNERELAVVLEFGKVVKEINEPGLYFKIPLVQEVRRLPKTRQFWSNAANDVLVDLPTKDGKKIEISIWAIWRIDDPGQFVKVMRTVDNAEQQVRQRVRAGRSSSDRADRSR